MKKKLLLMLQPVLIIASILFAYRLGYLNACDEYIDASECKPSRRLRFFE